MSDVLPDSWVLTTLGETCAIVGGATPDTKDPTLWGEDVAWVTPADLAASRAKYVSRGARSLTQLGFDSCSAQKIPAGSVLFSSRAPIGYVAITTAALSTNQGFKSLVPPGEISPEFLYWYMRWVTPTVVSMASGTTFAEVSGKVVARVPLRLPPRNEQERIADVLEREFTTLAVSESSVRTTSRLSRGLLASLMVAAVSGRLKKPSGVQAPTRSEVRARRDVRVESRQPDAQPAAGPVVVPGGWTWVSLSDVCWDIGYGTSTRCAYDGGGRAVLRIPNVIGGKIDSTDMKRAVDTGVDLAKQVVAAGDVLVVRTNGSRNLIGRCAASTTDTDVAFASYLIRLRVLQDVVDPEWVVLVLSSPHWRALLEERSASTAGQLNLSIGKLSDIPMPLPPLEEQRAIVREFAEQRQLIDSAERELTRQQQRLEQLRVSMLEAAFSGRLVPQDPYDEPAEILMKRIAEDRVAAALTARTRTPRTVRAARTVQGVATEETT